MLILAIAAASIACSRPEIAACRALCGEGGLCPRGERCGTDGYCHGDGDDSVCGAASTDDGGTSPDDEEPSDDDGGPNGDGDGGPSASCDDDPGCVMTPAPTCVSSSTRRVFTGPGECVAGQCSFPFTDRVCTAGCAGTQCSMPEACALLCEHVGDCGGNENSCRTTCRDSCPVSEFDDLETCTDTICEQLGSCLDQIVSCL